MVPGIQGGAKLLPSAAKSRGAVVAGSEVSVSGMGLTDSG